MTILYSKRAPDGMYSLDSVPKPPVTIPFASFLERIGVVDVLSHLHPFLSQLEQVKLILTKNDKWAWGQAVRRIDLTQFQKRNELRFQEVPPSWPEIMGRFSAVCNKFESQLNAPENVGEKQAEESNPKGDKQLRSLLERAPFLQELAFSCKKLDLEDYKKIVEMPFLKSLVLANSFFFWCLVIPENFKFTRLALTDCVTSNLFLAKQGPELTHLDLQKTTIEEVQFDRFPALENLAIKHVRLSKAHIEQICNLSALRSLTLYHFVIPVGSGLTNLGQLKNLERLTWEDTPMQEGEFQAIAQLPKLRTLDCSSCNTITDAYLEMLPNNSLLETLHLKGCKEISDEGVNALGKLSGLQTLSLNGYRITNLKPLAQLNNLQTLHLEGFNNNMSGLENCVKLETLILEGYFCSNDRQSFYHCPLLRHLHIKNNRYLHLKNKRCISKVWCSYFQDERKNLGLPAVKITIEDKK